jgi:hypothetical protein
MAITFPRPDISVLDARGKAEDVTFKSIIVVTRTHSCTGPPKTLCHADSFASSLRVNFIMLYNTRLPQGKGILVA